MKIKIKTLQDLKSISKLYPNGHLKNEGVNAYWVFKFTESKEIRGVVG